MKQCFPDVIAELLLEQTFHAYVCPESVVFPFFSDVGLHNAKWRILKDTVERETDRQTERDRQTGRQTGRQTETETEHLKGLKSQSKIGKALLLSAKSI